MGQLFEAIKNRARTKGELTSLSPGTILDAYNSYAMDYFYGDVRATLVGLVDQSSADKVLSVLKSVPGDLFSQRSILDVAKGRGDCD